MARQHPPTKALTIGHLMYKIFWLATMMPTTTFFPVGKTTINISLKNKGIEHTAIRHKFLGGADNENHWEYVFFNTQDTLYHQKSSYSPFASNASESQKKGKRSFVQGKSK